MTDTAAQTQDEVITQIVVPETGDTIRLFDIKDTAMIKAFLDGVLLHIDTWDDLARTNQQAALTNLVSGPNLLYTVNEGEAFIHFSDIQLGMQASVHVMVRSRHIVGNDYPFYYTCALASYHAGLQRIYAVIPDWKNGAARAANRTMVYEGTMRSCLLYHETWRDGHLFSLIRPDLPVLDDEVIR